MPVAMTIRSPGRGALGWLIWSLMPLIVLQTGPKTAASETLVERGDYLVNSIMACGNCHTPKDANGKAVFGKHLSGGGAAFDAPPFFVTVSNITPDRETGIGTWSNTDIKRALIEGIRPDHVRLPGVPLASPMFVNFNKALTARDLDAVVSYLRTVPPVRNEIPGPEYRKPFGRVPYPDAEKVYTEDALEHPVTRGAYLATIGHCMACHSSLVDGQLNYTIGFGRGGRHFLPSEVIGFERTWQGSVAKNITSHATSGIGAWTDAEIKRAITQGISRDGRMLKPPMAFAGYANMTDADLSAIVAWLRTVPPLE